MVESDGLETVALSGRIKALLEGNLEDSYTDQNVAGMLAVLQ